MKKFYITILVIISILLILFIFSVIYLRKDDAEINKNPFENASSIGLSDNHEFLLTCYQNRTNNFSESCLDNGPVSSIISKKDIDKLNLIKDIKGIEICSNNYEALNVTCYPEIIKNLTESYCEEIWGINYEKFVERPHLIAISVYECDKDYYLYKTNIAVAGLPFRNLYQINISEETAKTLKNN